ncbi:MAG: DNA primase large subunit PriL [Candidatus Jordarchaeales archaeon]
MKRRGCKIISRHFIAKYPFTLEAQTWLKERKIDLDDLVREEYRIVLERGKERVLSALEEGVVSLGLDDPEAEFLSFPVARLIVEVVGDPFLRHRFAVAEAKRAQGLFRNEDDDTLIAIATQTFGINCKFARKDIGGRRYPFKIHFADYLRYASGFHDPYWKLVNRVLSGGYVFLVKEDFTRILASAVEKKLSEPREPPVKVPSEVKQIVSEIAIRVIDKREKYAFEKVEGEIVEEAFPPCIAALVSALRRSQSLSHNARFTLTSFLLNVGYPVEKVISLFSEVPDFKEDLTRYQVEHIAGMKSGTRYTPPKCETMRTYGLCLSREECGNVKHPLEYYRKHRRRHIKEAES